jgi:GT2 family glycosyltransferase
MSGCIGITANDAGRYTLFAVSLNRLRRPPNTHLAWSLTSDRVLGRNSCVKQAFEVGAEWVLFIDDDHVFGSELLMQLLDHDQPVVGGLYLQRMQPFGPIAYSAKDEDGVYEPLDLTKYKGDELVEVEAIGTGGLLVRSEVLRAIGEPWFEHHVTASEDLVFCERAKKAGFPIYADLGARLGHMTPSSIWASFESDSWHIAFDVSDGCRLHVPWGTGTN